MCAWSNHKCKFVLYKARMAEWCKRIFENMTAWGHVIGAAKVEIG
jgi:hypothetical protein